MSDIYVYAVLGTSEQVQLARCGLPDGRMRVTTLPVAGMAAVISEYRGPAFRDLPKAELLRRLAIHQQVIEQLIPVRRVLPAKFGTLMSSRTDVRNAMSRFRERLRRAFERVGDTVEIEVAATWELGPVFAEIGQEAPIAALAASIASAAGQAGQDILALRIQVGKMVKESLDRRRLAHRERIMKDLAHLVVDAQPNPLPADEMVANVAFLIERHKRDEFLAQVHRLDLAFENRLSFRCIGPLPPYSFATVTLLRPNSEEIDAARRLLQLDEQVSEAELNSAYRHLAARCHPDHNPGDATAAERFAALANSHTQLLSYLRARAEGDGAEGREDVSSRRHYDLSPGAVDEMTLLMITRSEPENAPHAEPTLERELIRV